MAGRPTKLKGKEKEILALRDQGVPEFRVAIMYGVYPFAIRCLVKRLRKERDEAQFAGSK